MDEPFFRAQYDADEANRKRQDWAEYRKWVSTFYEGKRFPPVPGWASREADILKRLPAAAHGTLRPRLEATGRRLAAEWAKDNAVRRVSTADLQAWGKRFGDAAADPASLEEALGAVEAELAQRLS